MLHYSNRWNFNGFSFFYLMTLGHFFEDTLEDTWLIEILTAGLQ